VLDLHELVGKGNGDATRWLETWFSPEAQSRLRAAVARLSR